MEYGSWEVIWLRNVLTELDSPQRGPVAFYCDSTAAIHIASNPVFHERTKHIELDYHQVKERVVTGFIKLLHVRTNNQIADIFTKALFSPQLYSLVGKMALKSIYLPSWGGILEYRTVNQIIGLVIGLVLDVNQYISQQFD